MFIPCFPSMHTCAATSSLESSRHTIYFNRTTCLCLCTINMYVDVMYIRAIATCPSTYATSLSLYMSYKYVTTQQFLKNNIKILTTIHYIHIYLDYLNLCKIHKISCQAKTGVTWNIFQINKPIQENTFFPQLHALCLWVLCFMSSRFWMDRWVNLLLYGIDFSQ